MIEVDCPSCFMPYRLKPELAGKKIRCRSCQGVISVPRPGADRPQVPDEEWDETPLEEDLPPRPQKKRSGKPGKRRRRKETKKIKWAIVGIAASVIFGILLMMGVAGIFFRPIWGIMVVMVWVVAAAMSIVGGFGCMIAAFEEDAMCGVMWLFIPFYSFYYVITRFSEIMIWVLLWLAGIVMTFVAICLGALLVGVEEGKFAGGGGGGGGFLAPGNAQQSEDNVRAIGLASHNFHDVYNSFPPSPPEAGDQPMSWQTALLPFIDENALYQQVDTAAAWNAPANQQPMGTIVAGYLQPSIRETTSDGFGLSHYAINQGFLNDSGEGIRIHNITDGTSNTLMIGEVGAGFKPWGDPSNARDPAGGLRPSPTTFGNPSGQGAYFVLADGSVRFIDAGIDPETLKALSTIGGGDIPRGF